MVNLLVFEKTHKDLLTVTSLIDNITSLSGFGTGVGQDSLNLWQDSLKEDT